MDLSQLPQPGLLMTIGAFLVLLTVLVFVHEMGHYLAARACGTRVEVFSIGFGPELFGWNDKRGTRWRISVLPLGGYVRFFGDANAASGADQSAVSSMSAADRAVCFHYKPVWQRAIIVAAGPLINIAFAIVIFAGLYFALGQPYAEPIVGGIAKNSPAEQAGLKLNDRIVAVDGTTIDSWEDLQSEIIVNPDMPVTLGVKRAGFVQEIRVTPRKITETDRFGNTFYRGQLGIMSTRIALRDLGPIDSLGAGVDATFATAKLMVVMTGRVITGRQSLDVLGGPVKMAQTAGIVAALGLIQFISMIASASVSLGIVNLLPIPALDGGHLALYGLEALRKRPLSVRLQEIVQFAGVVMVLCLIVLLTVNDLS